MSEFKFSGNLPASKSMMNRALLIQSYFPELKIEGQSDCDDVLHMKGALNSLTDYLSSKSTGELTVDCGEAGTVLRFMALRVAREKGTFHLRGSRRLFERPQHELIYLLEQLGVQAELSTNNLKIQSQGWLQPMTALAVHRNTSSQFATSLLLNSWNLPWPYSFDIPGAGYSEGYWKMSLNMAEQVGMSFQWKDHHFSIEKGQTAVASVITTEPDYSSAFALVAAGILAGEVQIENFTGNSLQPDYVFLEILKKMDIPYSLKGSVFKISPVTFFNAVSLDVASTPDLVPVLSVLCAFAKGKSIITGIENLKNKESDRLKKSIELLTSAGFSAREHKGALEIDGCEQKYTPKPFWFNPDQDHRMAMAAGLLMKKGFAIKLSDASVVTKSYTNFWRDIGFNV